MMFALACSRGMRRAAALVTVAALVAVAGCGGSGGGTPPTPNPNPNPNPAPNPAPNPTPNPNPSPTPTPSPNPNPAPATFTASMRAEETPCVAPGSGPVSCVFVASTNGGTSPFTYRWTFSTPLANVTIEGQRVSPELGCGFAAGVTTFDIQIALRVLQTGGGPDATTSNNQQVARLAGACGT